MIRAWRHPTLLRRLVIFFMALSVLGFSGLGLLLFRWSGDRGAPPTARLYVAGDFEGRDVLASLQRVVGGPGNTCYSVQVSGSSEDDRRVCRGKALRVWVEDALLDLSIGARGVPRVSIAGLRARAGDWIGSLADPNRLHPRFPLRAAGVPAMAARVVHCPATPATGLESDLCLEVHDRLGRLAIVRSATGAVEVLRHRSVVPLHGGDVLWLGLVAFEAGIERGAGRTTALVLDRVDRLRPQHGPGVRRASDLGGDRRWLGRLWHVESPDPGSAVPDRFEILPMKARYTPYNLSRQRTNLEGEDVVQRLVDGGWLCLKASPTGPSEPFEVVWQPLDQPGCSTEPSPGAVTPSAVDDYRRARFGDLSFLAGSLVNTANVVLAERRYLEDATSLPLVFDWRLSYRDGLSAAEARRVPQPIPHRLWGVRFGSTRQVRTSTASNRGLLPAVLPRSTTARHLLQVLRDDELELSLYLVPPLGPPKGTLVLPPLGPPKGTLPPTTTRAAATRGAICLGRHDAAADGLLLSYRPTSGSHYPLGSVAFGEDPRTGTWSPDPEAPCSGCRLTVEVTENDVTENAGAGSELAISASGECDGLSATLPASAEESLWLRHGDEIALGSLRLRYVERGDRPWLAATDPATRRRHFAEEFYRRGRLRPMLGDAAGLSGVEAALHEYLADAGEIGFAPSSLELSIDGDLQLAAAAIVDALARPQIAEDDPEPHRVSVTAVILDARGGDLLAVVNWSSLGSSHRFHHGGLSEHDRRGGLSHRFHRGGLAWVQPTTWELGSGQADVLENAALSRRGAIGSAMKITGSYALLNNDGLVPGPEIDRRRRGIAFQEVPGSDDRGRLYLVRGAGEERPSRRRCSTGPHFLPAGDAGFTVDTFIRRFALSCNNFFVMTGFRYAGDRPAKLSEPRIWPPGGAGPQELLIDLRRRDQPILAGPAPEVQSLADRIRDGLAAQRHLHSDGVGREAVRPQPSAVEAVRPQPSAVEAVRPQPSAVEAVKHLPRSIYAILLRLGFQPRPDLFPVRGEAPAELRFDHRGQTVAVPLVNDWFAPTGGAATPALRSGRDFSYLGIPSPARLDEATVRDEPALEHYDGVARPVRRLAEGRADVQYAMLMIGQSSVEASALGLATLYAPAAREDGRAVSPCLFRANCGPQRAGAQVIDGPAAAVLNQALFGVMRFGTARGGLWRTGRRGLPDRGWGGKTGTFEVERQQLVGLSPEQWQRLRSWSCGVAGVTRPRIAGEASRVAELAASLSQAPAGSALGARACEDPGSPLNPAGVHGYGRGDAPAKLDELAVELARTAETETLIYHSFVALAPPARGTDGIENAAQGLVIAVLVDRETSDRSLAVQIGAELAAAVERWVTSTRD